jgi:monoamine oxidase
MAIRMGVGYKRRFWEEDDAIYGGQSFTNIPELSILGYPDNDYNAQKGVLLNAYAWGTDAAHLSTFSYQDRIDRILEMAVKIHPQMKEEYESGFSVAWHLEPYSLGAWPNYNERSRTEFYPRLQEPDGRVYLVGEHLSYVNAWMEGAVQSAWMQVEKLHTRVMQG